MKTGVYSDDRNAHVRQTTMTRSRIVSLAAGVLYLITFLSLPAFAFYAPLRDPNYMVGPGPDNPVIFGGVLEIIVALACIGTAVALYPVVKRQNEAVALGFVGARTLEAATIFAGVVCLLTMVTLRQSGVGAQGLVSGQALTAMYDWFHIGQDLIPGVNAVLLGSLLYRARLVPRILPLLGFIGAPWLVANVIMIMFGITGPLLTLTTLGVLPIAVWEFSLGVWLIVKGFHSTPITAEFDKMATSR